ncbi:P-loop containing nucleoside triphosphate hydrolase protein, partial [Schizopora paradoxa]
MARLSHEQVKLRSFKNLDEARKTFKEKDGKPYDSRATRSFFTDEIKKRMDGKCPFDWQLDLGEALYLGLDSVMIARTGAGKTLPFALPALLGGTVLVLSPLNMLQDDHVESFEKLGLRALAINGDTWSEDVRKKILKDEVDIILTSPEMCFLHEGFRDLFTSSNFAKKLAAIIIDECHLIVSWGDKFRPTYSQLATLRSLVPVGIPVLATSATLSPAALDSTATTLEIDLKHAFYVNLGNDRPNITYRVNTMSSQRDYDALRQYFTGPYTKLEDIERTVVFVDKRIVSQIICKRVRTFLPALLRGAVAYYHSVRRSRAKRRIMRQFRSGKRRILIATEAAGMGADIPDIARVIQFGVPNSLSTWLQRAGRAGRCQTLQASAILLAERSMFEKQRPKAKKNVPGNPVPPFPPMMIRAKKVDPTLRQWIEATVCRRDVADEYYDNPPRTIVNDYMHSVFSPESLLPTIILNRITSKPRIRTVEDILREVEPRWAFAKKHGEDLLARLRVVDEERNQRLADERRRKAEEKAE